MLLNENFKNFMENFPLKKGKNTFIWEKSHHPNLIYFLRRKNRIYQRNLNMFCINKFVKFFTHHILVFQRKKIFVVIDANNSRSQVKNGNESIKKSKIFQRILQDEIKMSRSFRKRREEKRKKWKTKFLLNLNISEHNKIFKMPHINTYNINFYNIEIEFFLLKNITFLYLHDGPFDTSTLSPYMAGFHSNHNKAKLFYTFAILYKIKRVNWDS